MFLYKGLRASSLGLKDFRALVVVFLPNPVPSAKVLGGVSDAGLGVGVVCRVPASIGVLCEVLETLDP